MNNKGYGSIRLMIKIAAGFGIFMMVFAFGFYMDLLTNPSIWEDGNAFLSFNSVDDLISYRLFFLLFIIWSTINTLVLNIAVIQYSTLDDAEFIANKWTLAILSITIGGMFTPFLLIKLPNTNTSATKNARGTLVKMFGLSWGIASIASLATIGGIYGSLDSQVFAGNQMAWFASLMSIFGVLAVLNITCSSIFFTDYSTKQLAAGEKGNGLIRAVAAGYSVIATVKLGLQFLSSLFSMFSGFNRGNNSFTRSINGMFQMARSMFMMFLIAQVIKGLWVDRGNSMKMDKYAKYGDGQTNQNQRGRMAY